MTGEESAKSKLKDLLNSNSEKKVEDWLAKGLNRIEKEKLRSAIDNNFTPDILIFNHFHRYTENPVLGRLIKLIFRRFWDTAEALLVDANRVYNEIVAGRPDLEELLSTEKGKRWLNYALQNSYANIYRWVWLDENVYKSEE